ncbi:hypothetical protein GCM10010124_22690 [Pilimelia terevasa]|uniref:DUF3263 domain-containing protein n=1 Tax=Pilimelia terevasa TaxID=53372 RepID=A0A8J3BRZ2_9ACTN|nr:DUF3263 domain-containing protein [Pilimelia terevasa]GGK29379.1 hypothetical protein GCM10010124_22690 [Pilimelia terevasa]
MTATGEGTTGARAPAPQPRAGAGADSGLFPAPSPPPAAGDEDGTGDGAARLADGAPAGELTPREREILDFERRWWRSPGAKEQAIHDAFGLSATRYYQVLRGLLDRPAALAHDPVLVGRLRRLRGRRGRGTAVPVTRER